MKQSSRRTATIVTTGIVIANMLNPLSLNTRLLKDKAERLFGRGRPPAGQMAKGSLFTMNEASAQEITPEVVAAWIKAKKEARTNRDWRNAPFLNGATFGFGRDPPGARYNTLGASDSLGQTILLLNMKDIFNELGVQGNTKFAKIGLLNKLEDGTHVYLLADAGMKGAVVLSQTPNKTNVPMTTLTLPFALSDDFYIVESTGQGAVIVDSKNNKVIFVNAKTESILSYDIQINGGKSDAVAVDGIGFAIVCENTLEIINAPDSKKSTSFDLSSITKGEGSQPNAIVVNEIPEHQGAFIVIIDGEGWKKTYMWAVMSDGGVQGPVSQPKPASTSTSTLGSLTPK